MVRSNRRVARQLTQDGPLRDWMEARLRSAKSRLIGLEAVLTQVSAHRPAARTRPTDRQIETFILDCAVQYELEKELKGKTADIERVKSEWLKLKPSIDRFMRTCRAAGPNFRAVTYSHAWLHASDPEGFRNLLNSYAPGSLELITGARTGAALTNLHRAVSAMVPIKRAERGAPPKVHLDNLITRIAELYERVTQELVVSAQVNHLVNFCFPIVQLIDRSYYRDSVRARLELLMRAWRKQRRHRRHSSIHRTKASRSTSRTRACERT
jgi:hypothetical protein